jgi:hypothetical protein
MDELLSDNFSIDFFDRKFTEDLLEMYNQPDRMNEQTKNRIKATALSLTQNFNTRVLEFYKQHGRSEMSDNDFDTLFVNMNNFLTSILVTINPLRNDRFVYASVALMWTGILTKLEREANDIGDIGLLMTTQNILSQLLRSQSEYYATLRHRN